MIARSILFFLALAACHARAAEGGLPPADLPRTVGVNIHFTTGRERDLDLLAEAGIRIVRMDFFWADTERERGKYDFSAYDALTGALEKRGMRAFYILDYSNPLYEPDGNSPQHPASVEAFARWAAAAAEHFRGRGVMWEIWNEPNIGFWKGEDRPSQYRELALATARALRKSDPEATILAPASSGFPWEFFETLFRSGILRDLDAVSVHPYRGEPPETVSPDYAKLRELIDRYAPPRKKIPIVSGEWGYSSRTGGVSPETQADYAVRQQLWNLSRGIAFSIWYDWMNDGPDRGENEHNFGLVAEDLQPKPAYLAIREMTRELTGYRFAKRLGGGDDVVLEFVRPEGGRKIAAWTLGDPHETDIPGAGRVRLSSRPVYRELTGE